MDQRPGRPESGPTTQSSRAAEVDSNADRFWMQRALELAAGAGKRDEVPVGAVIVLGGELIGAAANEIEALEDPTAHAEMLAIRAATRAAGSRRLLDTTLYVTLEPCAMCAGAVVLARIPRLVFGACDPKAGACGSLRNIAQDSRLNHRCEVVGGLLAEESAGLLRGFFAALREGAVRRP